MTWAIVVSAVVIAMALGQLRVHRTEKIRLKCLGLASDCRHVNGGRGSIVECAVEFEKYVREGKSKEKPVVEDTS